MSQTRIIYATKTRHSKKLAEAAGNALKIEAENITARPVIKGVDLLFIVGGIYGGESMPELLEYIGTLEGREIKKAALITSSASKTKRQESVRKLLKDKGIEVADEMLCQGSFLFVGAGHPNKSDLEAAAAFAVRISQS
jgi:hypothetical protein